MTRERMREVLAAAMGWMLYTDNGGGKWLEPPDRAEIPFCDWDPFTSLEQAWLVIEEMRAKGWRDSIDYDGDVVSVNWWKDPYEISHYAEDQDEKLARMLAACHALEGADG